MTARLASLLAPALLAAAPAAVPAQTPPVSPPAPAQGSAAFSPHGGLATHKARYYAPGQQVTLRGRVRPFVAGQVVTLHVVRKGKESKWVRRRVRRGGRFVFRFKVGSPGLLRLVVAHAGTEEQVAFRARDQRIRVVSWSAGEGARGVHVLLLQRGLHRLGFATPVTGYFDAGTARGVTAFRKTNGLGSTGHASSSVYAMLFRRRGAFELRHPRAGKHVEFDWSRQVLVLANKRRAYRVYHSSSGAPATPTVFGSFRFYLKTPGTNSHGMVHSNYFIGGYAIHGYASVPNYPASHGCLRVPIPNAAQIYRWVELGNRIFVYR
jgi:lipoprotein-anchoring transpeptidase ErfK/SrfK